MGQNRIMRLWEAFRNWSIFLPRSFQWQKYIMPRKECWQGLRARGRLVSAQLFAFLLSNRTAPNSINNLLSSKWKTSFCLTSHLESTQRLNSEKIVSNSLFLFPSERYCPQTPCIMSGVKKKQIKLEEMSKLDNEPQMKRIMHRGGSAYKDISVKLGQ